jgi:hypothetical protein
VTEDGAMMPGSSMAAVVALAGALLLVNIPPASTQATQASCFPMLPDGVHAGINGGPGLPTKMAAAYDGIVKAGGDLAQIGVTWADVEPTKGMYDFSGLLGELQWAQSQGQHSVVGVRN